MRKLAALLLLSACGGRPLPPPSAPEAPPDELDPRAIVELMVGVADRELARPLAEGWQGAAFLDGLLELGQLTGEARYSAAVRAAGESRGWRPDGALALPAMSLFARDRDRRFARASLEAFDRLCDPAQPSALPAGAEGALTLAALDLGADAIGRPRYRECAHKLWASSAEALSRVAPPEQGWVLFVLSRLLESADDGRDRYRAGWQRMIAAGGADPVAAALVLRARAAGVNRGLLPAGEQAAVRRSWLALARAPRPEGAEASAAFLLAGAEMFRLALLENSRSHPVTLANPLAQPRFLDTAEIPWAPLARALGAVPGDPIVVLDARTGELLPSQLLDENGDALAERLLVSVNLSGNESRKIVVHKLARPFRPARPAVRAYGRFVPEAQDDFAWENDRVAFRVYGPALEPQHLSSGIDVWAKRVREPVIDRWYRRADLHTDRGEGLDFYRVGPSRGCGGLGLWDDKELSTSRNFRRWRLIADGPVRVEFQLDYDAWGPASSRVTETKRISLDLGQNLSRIEVRFGVAGPPRALPVAVGVVRRGEGTLARDEPTTWLSYVEPPQGESGQIGCGVIGPETARFVESPQHYLLVRDHPSNRPFVYYAGAYWSKGPDFRQPDEWGVYLAAFSRRASAPITATVE